MSSMIFCREFFPVAIAMQWRGEASYQCRCGRTGKQLRRFWCRFRRERVWFVIRVRYRTSSVRLASTMRPGHRIAANSRARLTQVPRGVGPSMTTTCVGRRRTARRILLSGMSPDHAFALRHPARSALLPETWQGINWSCAPCSALQPRVSIKGRLACLRGVVTFVAACC